MLLAGDSFQFLCVTSPAVPSWGLRVSPAFACGGMCGSQEHLSVGVGAGRGRANLIRSRLGKRQSTFGGDNLSTSTLGRDEKTVSTPGMHGEVRAGFPMLP